MRCKMNFKSSTNRCSVGTAINFEITKCQTADPRDCAV